MTTSAFRHCLASLAILLCTITARADDDPPACKYVMAAELPLRYTGPSLSITTDGTLNGQPAVMLVDTGASNSLLTRTATERLGLDLRMTGQHVIGIGGFSRVYSTRLNEFAVGPAKTSKGWFSVVGDTGSAPAWDAIVGAPFLLQADLEFSLAEKKLRFFRPKDCKHANLGYWGGEVFELPFVYHSGRSPNPHFEVEVNGQKMEAMIDSGAVVTTIFAGAARRAGLKLDAPGTVRIGDMVGVGTDHVARWRTLADLRIGAEMVRNAEIGVLDTSGPDNVDITLGDDFLRTHRVLFAMSQEKLYVSYLGGEPFKQAKTVEPWLVQEADSGNADAQLVLASAYFNGRGVPKDAKQGDAWLDKAAAQGHPQATLQLGYRLLAQHHFADAATQLRAALDKLPAERNGALRLYLARLQSGQADLGKRELETAFAHSERDEWPAPIADFYLGKIDAAALFDAAGKESKLSKARTCTATGYAAELYKAQGDTAQAESMTASYRAHCGAAAQGT